MNRIQNWLYHGAVTHTAGDMAKDMDFNRKWMFAIAMSLKKGLHLNIIHNIDRPFHEMMLGLESWIPKIGRAHV